RTSCATAPVPGLGVLRGCDRVAHLAQLVDGREKPVGFLLLLPGFLLLVGQDRFDAEYVELAAFGVVLVVLRPVEVEVFLGYLQSAFRRLLLAGRRDREGHGLGAGDGGEA